MWRKVRLSEFFRVRGAGYRVLGQLSLGYAHIGKLPKKWFRLWLLIHHPRSSTNGIPWIWWLSAGRPGLIPPEIVGALHFELLDAWYRQMEEGWTLSASTFNLMDSIPYVESVTYRPWVKLYLDQVASVACRLIQG